MSDESQSLHWQARVICSYDGPHLAFHLGDTIYADDSNISADAAYTTSRRWLNEEQGIFEVVESYLPSDDGLAENDTKCEHENKRGHVILRKKEPATIINYRTNTHHLANVGGGS